MTIFLLAVCPSDDHPTNSVKALKETQSSDSSQWSGLILSSSTTGLPAEEALCPLWQIADTITSGSIHT